MIKIGTLDGGHQRSSDQFDVVTHATGVGHIYSQRQGGAHHRITRKSSHRLVHDTFREHEAGPHMNPKSQVRADTTEGCRGVEVSAGQVEAVAGPEHRLEQGRFLSPLLDGGLPIAPGLITQR